MTAAVHNLAEILAGSARRSRGAVALRAVGVAPGDRVGLLGTKSAAMVAAMQGVLRADAVYVPLDLPWPADRLALIARNCGIATVVSDAAGERLTVLWAHDYLGFDAGDRLLCHAPLTFDLPVSDRYNGFLAGATVVLLSEEDALFPGATVRCIVGEDVTVALASHPGVAEAAVVALLDADAGHLLYACCVLQGEPTSPRELQAHVSRILPPYMVPSEVFAVAALLKTTSGKVSRLDVANIVVERKAGRHGGHS